MLLYLSSSLPNRRAVLLQKAGTGFAFITISNLYLRDEARFKHQVMQENAADVKAGLYIGQIVEGSQSGRKGLAVLVIMQQKRGRMGRRGRLQQEKRCLVSFGFQ